LSEVIFVSGNVIHIAPFDASGAIGSFRIGALSSHENRSDILNCGAASPFSHWTKLSEEQPKHD
jgi:hypothetical protein